MKHTNPLRTVMQPRHDKEQESRVHVLWKISNTYINYKLTTYLRKIYTLIDIKNHEIGLYDMFRDEYM